MDFALFAKSCAILPERCARVLVVLEQQPVLKASGRNSKRETTGPGEKFDRCKARFANHDASIAIRSLFGEAIFLFHGPF